MVSLLIITHEDFGRALLESSQHLLGDQQGVEALGLGPDDSRSFLDAEIAEAMGRLDQGDGVLVLVDLVGGTPFNAAASAMSGHRLEVVTGLSLPMLVDALTLRGGKDLQQLAQAIKERSSSWVVTASDLFRRRRD